MIELKSNIFWILFQIYELKELKNCYRKIETIERQKSIGKKRRSIHDMWTKIRLKDQNSLFLCIEQKFEEIFFY